MASKLLVWTLVVLCILALFTNAPFARADDDVEEGEEADINEANAEDADPTEVDDIPTEQQRPAEEVFTTYLFPDNTDKKFPAGEKVTVLVGFQNRGDSVYNLTHIGASLHSPFDFNYYIQNFTYREVNALVGPGEEGSVEYTFTPDKSLEAHLEFQLSISLYYNDTTENKFWRSTIHNSTIELSEAKSDFSIKNIFTYILAFAALGLAAFIGINLTGVLNAKTNAKVKVVAASASEKAAASASWETPVYQPKAKSTAFGKKKKVTSSKGDAPASPKSS